MKIIINLSLIFILFIPLYTFAVTDLTIVSSPVSPTPFSQVTLTLKSYATNVNSASIVWYVSGKEIKRGVGDKTITISTGAVGTASIVKAVVSTVEGDVLETSITVAPQSISLIWESLESYVPPFYKGKALPGEGSTVRVTAIPNITEGNGIISPSSLSYSWYINGDYNDKLSGANKSSAVFRLDQLSDSTNVKVKIITRSGFTAEKSLDIYPHEVIPSLYEVDPTLGVDFSKMFTKRIETYKDIILSLQPYYLSTRLGLENSTDYIWLLDGLPVTPEEKTTLALRPQINSSGTRKLYISIKNNERRLQKADLSTEIIFDARQ